MSWAEVGSLAAILSAILGATWMLRGKLSELEVAVATMMARGDERHHDLEKRVVRLEDYRGSLH